MTLFLGHCVTPSLVLIPDFKHNVIQILSFFLCSHIHVSTGAFISLRKLYINHLYMWVDDVDTGHKKKKKLLHYYSRDEIIILPYYLLSVFTFFQFEFKKKKNKINKRLRISTETGLEKRKSESLEKYLNVMFLYVIHLKIINMTL